MVQVQSSLERAIIVVSNSPIVMGVIVVETFINKIAGDARTKHVKKHKCLRESND